MPHCREEKWKKSWEIAVLIFCEINNNALSFSVDLPVAHLPCETPNMECFAKLINDWIHSTKFGKSYILDVLLGSECVSDYLWFFSIIMGWG